MNVLHLRASNFYGGPERQLHFHARLARQAGLNLIVSSFSEQGKQPEFLNMIAADGIPVHTFEVKSGYDTKAIRKVGEYLKANDIDILCTHDYRTHMIGMLARGKEDLRWVAFSRGFTKENLKIRFFHTLDKIFIRQADHIVAVSASQKKKLERLFVPSKKITVVHNAIDSANFEAIDPIDLKRKFAFPSDSIVLISGGRFSEEKGQVYLVKAALQALKEQPNVRFVLFGDGPDLEKMRSLVRENSAEQKILCPGFERSLAAHLKGADILVNPSLSEGLPNIVLEAMAVGVPVIATNVGGLPEIIENEVNGFLVPARDINSLTECIVRLAIDMDERKKIADKAARTVSEKFSFSGQNERLTELYQKVVSP
ncbi:MAG TPA: glycosyltransferase family 4 protein [candidate division Zixibacteria bacterium]|nr:glycosyltransferase family 4 protein [candidate division Zixibacteria bacterium]